MAQVGTVKELSGVAQAVGTDGSTRVLVVGDAINEGEVVVTVGASSSVKISFESGKELVLAGDEKSLIDQTVVSSDAVADADVTAIQQALLAGEDLPNEAPALGPDTADGTGGITEAYTAERTDGRGDVGTHNFKTARFVNGDVDGNQNDQINQAPIGVDDVATIDEDVTLIGNVLDNDIDDGLPNPEGDLDVVSVNGILPNDDGNIIVITEYGTLTLNAETGDYTYLSFNHSLAWDETTLESFTYVITDGELTDTATLNITLDGTNDQPVVSDVNLGDGHLDRFTFDGVTPTFYNNGSNSYNGMATISSDRVERISSDEAMTTLQTKLPSGSADWDGAKIYLYKGEVLTLTSDSDSNDYYIGIDDSNHSNGTPDPVTGAFKWDTLALTTEAGQSVTITASSDGWYYIGTGAVSGENSPYGLYNTTITINGTDIIYETHDADSTDGDTIDDGINIISGTLSAADLDVTDMHLFRLIPFEAQEDDNQQEDRSSFSPSHGNIIEIGYIDSNDASLNEDSTVQVEIIHSDVNISKLNIESIELFNNDAVDRTSDFDIRGDFSALGAGETVTLRLQYVADDTNGFVNGELPDENSVSEPAFITVIITGTNDQPVVENVNIGMTLASQTNEFLGTYSEAGEDSETFGKEQVSHTYNLGSEYAGKTVTLEFDMTEYGTWDGDGTWNEAHEATPEAFLAFVNGEVVVNQVMGLDGIDDNSVDGGILTTGISGTYGQTDLHHFTVQVTADENGDIALGFGSTLHEGTGNESFGISNLSIVAGQTIYESHDSIDLPNADDTHEDVYTYFNTGSLNTVTDDDVNDEHTYYLNQGTLHVDGIPTQTILLGHKEGDDFGLRDWGEEDNGKTRVMELDNGMTITTQSTSGQLHQYNNQLSHVGEGIGDNDNWGINAGEEIVVSFAGGHATSATFGFDGLGGHFDNGIATATWTAFNNGVIVASGSADVTSNGLFDVESTSIPFDEVRFGTISDSGSNWELKYVEAEVVPVDVVVYENGNYDLSGNFNYLAAGETAKVTFEYYAKDDSVHQNNGETNTSEPALVTVYITGTNDQPIVSDVNVETTEVINGLNTFVATLDTVADDDLNDTHTYEMVSGSVQVDGISVDDSLANIYFNNTTHEWEYKIEGDFNYLAEGVRAEVTFDYYATDSSIHQNNGETSQSEVATIKLTVVGTNDAPISNPDTITKISDVNFEHQGTGDTWNFSNIDVHSEYGNPSLNGDNTLGISTTETYTVRYWTFWGWKEYTNTTADNYSAIDGSGPNETIGFTFDSPLQTLTIGLTEFDRFFHPHDKATWTIYNTDGTTTSSFYSLSGFEHANDVSFDISSGKDFDRVEISANEWYSNFRIQSIDGYGVGENEFTIAKEFLLGNDIDVDGDTLSIKSLFEDDSTYSLHLNSDGDVVFTPTDDFNANSITFSYTAFDGHVESQITDVVLNFKEGTISMNDDTITYKLSTGEQVIGSDGYDILVVPENEALDLSNISNIETIEIHGTTIGDTTTGLTAEEVFSIAGGNELTITGEGVVNIDDAIWHKVGAESTLEVAVYVDTGDTIKLNIDTDIDNLF